jgi:DNA polymerase elongation subunit (family B)
VLDITNSRVDFWDFHVPIFDYMKLYKTYVMEKQDSYSLDYITSKDLGVGKLEYDGSLNDLWKNDPQKYIEYNIWDSVLIGMLEDKLKLTSLKASIAYEAKVLFSDVGSPVKIWDVMIYYHLKNRNIQIPPNKKEIKKEYPGAYIIDPKPGIYDWVVCYDINSLYPNIVISCNLDKSTLVDEEHYENFTPTKENQEFFQYQINEILNNKEVNLTELLELKDRNLCYTPNGVFWDRSRNGIVPHIMSNLYNERVEFKNKMKECSKNNDEKGKFIYYLKEQAFKILLNSGYGAFGNEYFRYYDVRVAGAITTTGQLIIKYISKRMEELLNDYIQVFYGDTESFFMSLNKLTSKFENKTKEEIHQAVIKFSSSKIEPELKKIFEEIGNLLNFKVNTLDVKLEYIADTFLSVAKKRYVARVIEKDKIKTKYKGVEIVRTSTPMIIREILKKFVDIILDKDKDRLLEKIKEFKSNFSKLSVEQIAFPRTVSDMDKYKSKIKQIGKLYPKATPIHVKGAIIYNFLLEKHKLTNTRKKIYSGDKIRFIYLKDNPLGDNVIAFLDNLPKEFDLHKYIDYETQFEKTFLTPLNTLAKVLNMDLIDLIMRVQSNNILDFIEF